MEVKDLSTIDLPTINLSAACMSDPGARKKERDELMKSFTTVGFCLITGLEGYDADELFKWTKWFFKDVSLDERMAQLATKAFNPQNKNLYRGFFPMRHGGLSHKEGYDISKPYPEGVVQEGNPFKERTPHLKLDGREAQVEEFYKVCPNTESVHGCKLSLIFIIVTTGDVQTPGPPGKGWRSDLFPDS